MIKKNRKIGCVSIVLIALFGMSITACNSNGVNASTAQAPGAPVNTPPVNTSPDPVVQLPAPLIPTKPTHPAPSLHANCVSSDPNQLCIGLKVAAYTDSSGISVLNEADAEVMVQQVNDVWKFCNIAFQIEIYDSVDPSSVGLTYGAGSQSQLNDIRNDFSTQSTMLVAVTGPWNGSTIAWTSMPGGGPFGTIVENDYGHNPFTVGHELGHYMGLYHVNDNSNLMNPYIGSGTSALSSEQCDTSRSTTISYWSAMLRK